MCNLPRVTIPAWMQGQAAYDIVAEATPLVGKIQTLLSSLRPNVVVQDDVTLTWQLACAVTRAALVLRGDIDRSTLVFTDDVPHLQAISDWLISAAKITKSHTMDDALVVIGHDIFAWRSGKIAAAQSAVASARTVLDKATNRTKAAQCKVLAEAETWLILAKAEEKLISALIGRLGKTVARNLADFIGDPKILTEGLSRQQEELIGEVRKPFARMLVRKEAA